MPSRFLTWAVAAIAAVAMTLSTAPQASASPVTITGTVTGQLPGQAPQPLADVKVDAHDPATSATVATTSTDTAGRYTLALESGIYDLTFTPPAGSSFTSTTAEIDTAWQTSLSVLLVPATSAGVTVSGVVRTSTGAPLPRVHLEFHDSDGRGFSAGTKADGSYSILLEAGTYTFSAEWIWDHITEEPRTDVPTAWRLMPESITLSQNTTIDLNLPDLATVTVQLLKDDNTPLTRTTIALSRPSTPMQVNGTEHQLVTDGGLGGTTNDDGIATFPVFNGSTFTQPGTVRPLASTGYTTTEFSIPAVNGSTTVTVHAIKQDYLTVSGVVRTSTGAPLPRVHLEFHDSDGRGFSAGTKADGSYSILLKAGTYTFSAEWAWDHITEEPRTDVPDSWLLMPESITLSENTTIDLDLPDLATVTVQLLKDDNTPLPRTTVAASVPSTPVQVNGTEHQLRTMGGLGGTTNDDGIVTFPVFNGSTFTQPGTVRPLASTGYTTTEFSIPAVNGSTTVTVHAIKQDYLTVSGVVRTSTGAPLPRVHLEFHDSDGRGFSAGTKADGSYSILLKAGTYTFGAEWAWDPITEEPRTDTPEYWRLMPESVTVSENTTINLDLPALATLTVQLLTDENTPLPRTAVNLPVPSTPMQVNGTEHQLTSGGGGGSTNNDGITTFHFFTGSTFTQPGTYRPPSLPGGSPLPTFEVPTVTGNTVLVIRFSPPDTTSPSISRFDVTGPAVVGAPVALFAEATDDSAVASAEWFVGMDPGEGAGVAIPVTNGTVSTAIEFLTPGLTTVGLRVRDAAGNWSAVSTVEVAVSPPDDGDAIDWQVEANAPNSGDGNADGVPDYEQTNVTSLPASGAEPGEDVPYVTVASATNADGSATALASVSTLDATSVAAPPDGVSLPAGLVDFVVNDVEPGGDVIVSFFVPSVEGVSGYAKLVDGTWTLLPQDRVTIDADASRVDVRLTDGGEGDADGLINGVIVDPGGVAVVGDVLSGFRAPVDMGNVLNRVKGGSTVPLKFELFRAGVEVTDTSAITGIRYQRVDCASLLAQADDVETLSTGATSLRYDSASGQFIQNWKTPRTAGCYRLTLTTPGLVDGAGASLETLFKLT